MEAWRKRYARGEVYVVRYADDYTTAFQHRDDAEAFHRALAQRMRKFVLELNTEKTRMIEFAPLCHGQPGKAGRGEAGDV